MFLDHDYFRDGRPSFESPIVDTYDLQDLTITVPNAAENLAQSRRNLDSRPTWDWAEGVYAKPVISRARELWQADQSLSVQVACIMAAAEIDKDRFLAQAAFADTSIGEADAL